MARFVLARLAVFSVAKRANVVGVRAISKAYQRPSQTQLTLKRSVSIIMYDFFQRIFCCYLFKQISEGRLLNLCKYIPRI